MHFKLTDVVKTLIIINVLVYLCYNILPSKDILPSLEFYNPVFKNHFKPYQIVTHMFAHANESHIFMNMLSLFFLGPHVERLVGVKRFLFLYLFCGFFALGTHMLWQYYEMSQGYRIGAVLGASGATYGVTMAFIVLFANEMLTLIFPPIPMKAKYLGLILIFSSVFSQVFGYQDNIAHLAHLGGAIAGGGLAYFWYFRK